MFEREYRCLLNINCASKSLRHNPRLLIYGTCVRDEYPEIYRRFAENRVSVAICLEQYHINIVALKIASILARVDLEELVVLTVDGSPHCIQLHHAVKEAVKVTGKSVKVRHYVVENGEAVEISESVVKAARYLTKIKKLMENK